MKPFGLVVCGISGAVGATIGYYVPQANTTAFVMGAFAVAMGAADFVIRDALQLVDEQIKQELTQPRTAHAVVGRLDETRRAILRQNIVAMFCKGVALAVAGLVTQGKASPLIQSIGGGALAFGSILTVVILLSHEYLVMKKNREAIERSEADAAVAAVTRLGDTASSPGVPERPVVSLKEDVSKTKPRSKK